jgi:hypothetical protein
MKQKDIIVLVAVAIVSAIASLLLSKSFFATPKDQSQKVETIDKITATFPYPSKKYFNAQAVNPAQLVEIGDNTNQNPFNAAP